MEHIDVNLNSLQTAEVEEPQASPSSTSRLIPDPGLSSHGTIPGNSVHDIGSRSGRGDRQVDGSPSHCPERGTKEDLQDSARQVRLDQGGVCRPEGCSHDKQTVRGEPLCGRFQTGQSLRDERPCFVADMSPMQAATHVRAGSRCEGMLPISRSNWQGCGSQADRESRSGTIGVAHQGAGLEAAENSAKKLLDKIQVEKAKMKVKAKPSPGAPSSSPVTPPMWFPWPARLQKGPTRRFQNSRKSK